MSRLLSNIKMCYLHMFCWFLSPSYVMTTSAYTKLFVSLSKVEQKLYRKLDITVDWFIFVS